jgi:uncharacterized protein (DUF1810 family)
MSLDRFLQAQERHGSYECALAELKAGEKTGHWIWWVFPQSRGLGTSERSTFYGLIDGSEAHAYFLHPVLGPRYRECVAVVHGHLCQGGVAPLALMGSEVDVRKLRSSLKLFLGITEPTEETFRVQADAILQVLGMHGA